MCSGAAALTCRRCRPSRNGGSRQAVRSQPCRLGLACKARNASSLAVQCKRRRGRLESACASLQACLLALQLAGSPRSSPLPAPAPSERYRAGPRWSRASRTAVRCACSSAGVQLSALQMTAHMGAAGAEWLSGMKGHVPSCDGLPRKEKSVAGEAWAYLGSPAAAWIESWLPGCGGGTACTHQRQCALPARV